MQMLVPTQITSHEDQMQRRLTMHRVQLPDRLALTIDDRELEAAATIRLERGRLEL